MTRLPRFGRSTGVVLCLLVVVVLSLCGCQSKIGSTRSIVPRVSCEAGPAALIPPLPDNPADEAEWIVTVLGLYQGEVTKRKAVRQCLADLRAAGAIR